MEVGAHKQLGGSGKQHMTDSLNTQLENDDTKLLYDFLTADGWKTYPLKEGTTGFVYRSIFATLKIEFQKRCIFYQFEEGEMKSLVQIDYQSKLPELLGMITADKSNLSSGQYGRHLKKIIENFPNIYYFTGEKYVLLINKD
ncbi:MAG: hypothetical protein IPP66_05980 [Anaerolineales bacterium]|nr:hypothetical protein [Anaerolineales bacterium]